MPTTDERREVAARLREEAELHKEGFDPLALIDCLGIDIDGELFNDGWHRYPERITFETWQRLADLIEPEERTCSNEAASNDYFACSGCGMEVDLYNDYGGFSNYAYGDWNYCPNCDAKVVE